VVQAVARADLAVQARALARGLSTYFLVLAPWATAETSEGLLRLPSAVAGCLLVLAVAWLGREVGGPVAGGWAGLAATLSPFLVWHAREARWYSLTWLLVTAALACLFRAARNGDWRWLGAFVVFGMAGSSTFWPAVVVPVTGLLWLVGARGLRTRFTDSWNRLGAGTRAVTLAAVGGCVVVLAAWSWSTLAAPLLRGGWKGYGFMNVGGPDPLAVAYTAVAFATGYTIGPGPSEWHTLSAGGVAPIDLLLLALGVLGAAGLLVLGLMRLRTEAGSGPARMALDLVVAPLGVLVIACVATHHTYAPRYAGIAYPLVLVTFGAALAGRQRRRLTWTLAGALAALQLGSLWNLHFNDRYQREDARSAAAYVGSRVGEAEAVLVFGGIDDPWRHYYRAAVPSRILHVSGGAAARSEEIIQTAFRGSRAIWVVSGRLWEEPGSEDLMALVAGWGVEAERVAFAGGVEVRRYAAPGADR
jgi:4-amino-4-deoxy-L-arabinose transferase-like glycosyltransferase